MSRILLILSLLCLSLKTIAQSDEIPVITVDNVRELKLLDAIYCPNFELGLYRNINIAGSGKQLVAIQGCDGDKDTVKIYDISDREFIQQITVRDSIVTCHILNISYDGNYIACSSSIRGYPNINIYSISTGNLFLQTETPEEFWGKADDYIIRRVIFSPESEYFYGFLGNTRNFQDVIQVWNLNTGEYIEQVTKDGLRNLYPLPVYGVANIDFEYEAILASDYRSEILSLHPEDTDLSDPWFFSANWDHVMGSFNYEPVGTYAMSQDETTIILSIPNFILIFGIPTTSRPTYSQVPAFIYPSGIELRDEPEYYAESIGVVEEGEVLISGRSEDNQFLHIRDVGWVVADYVNLGIIPIDELPTDN